MNQNEIEARLWDAADELRAEMHRSALNLSYDEQPMPDINPDNLDVRVASGLFAGLHEWNENSAENLNRQEHVRSQQAILACEKGKRMSGYSEGELIFATYCRR